MAERSANEMTYLVLHGQKEVIEVSATPSTDAVTL